MTRRPAILGIHPDVPLDEADIYAGGWVRDGLIWRPVDHVGSAS